MVLALAFSTVVNNRADWNWPRNMHWFKWREWKSMFLWGYLFYFFVLCCAVWRKSSKVLTELFLFQTPKDHFTEVILFFKTLLKLLKNFLYKKLKALHFLYWFDGMCILPTSNVIIYHWMTTLMNAWYWMSKLSQKCKSWQFSILTIADCLIVKIQQAKTKMWGYHATSPKSNHETKCYDASLIL